MTHLKVTCPVTVSKLNKQSSSRSRRFGHASMLVFFFENTWCIKYMTTITAAHSCLLSPAHYTVFFQLANGQDG